MSMKLLETIDRLAKRYPDKVIDISGLDPRFIPFYENGKRIEVEWEDGYEDYSGYGNRCEGKKARFTVGISTGWKPIFLMIYSKRSKGGNAICSKIKSIKEL